MDRNLNAARVSAAARQERSDRLRRDRAASQALRVAFPGIQHLRLELKFESSNATTPTLQAHVLHPPALAFFEYPCPYADCDGQFNLTAAVRAAVSSTTHQAVGMLECVGLRVRDRGVRQPCQLHLLYTVTATY